SIPITTLRTATITPQLQNTLVIALPTAFVCSFRTAANGCTSPPTVVSVIPLNGATGVCSLAVITATFSEAMNASSINTTTFTVSPGVTGTITHDFTNTIFNFTTSSRRASNTIYSPTLTSGSRDLFGNGLEANFV